jgi:hypothetical protein
MQRLNDKKKLPECDIKKETIGFTTTYASVPITTNVVSWNSAQESCTRYNICDKVNCQWLVAGQWFSPLWFPQVNFVSDLWQVSGFLHSGFLRSIQIYLSGLHTLSYLWRIITEIKMPSLKIQRIQSSVINTIKNVHKIESSLII